MSTKVKAVIVGDTGVGKTTLLITFANKEFPNDYIPTVMDTFIVNISCGDSEITLDVWDTAGATEYDRLRVLCYPGTHIFLIAYAVNDPSSLESVYNRWLVELKLHMPTTPFVLVATKAESRELAPAAVSTEEGIKTAKKIGALAYAEVSSIQNIGVQIVFQLAAGAARYPKAFQALGKKNCEKKSDKENILTNIFSKLRNKPKHPTPFSNGWYLLPPNILEHIATFLLLMDFCSILKVDKRTRTTCDTEELWKVHTREAFPFLDITPPYKGFLRDNFFKCGVVASIPRKYNTTLKI